MDEPKKPEMTRGERTNADIAALLRSKHTLLWIVTAEERRVEAGIVEAARLARFESIQFWDVATGVSDAKNRAISSTERDPSVMIEKIRSQTMRRIYVMRDLHRWLDGTLLRLLKSTARELEEKKQEESRVIIVVSTSGDIPQDIAGSVTVVEYPIPDRMEMGRILEDSVSSFPEEQRARLLPAADKEAATDAAVGLTAQEATNCYALSLVTAKRIDPARVAQEKKRVITREKVLSWYDPDPRGMDAIGGLDVLKAWLSRRKSAFSQEARAYGIPAPRGIFLAGVSGTGKSLTAKCVAAAWQLPLLRFDIGALRSKYVGESEANLRKALRVAEAVSPSIVWLDEIEKALAGASGPQGDGGVAADALGVILTWMQERKAPVFFIATANDVRGLPPELLRKGRFDELFWLDLPNEEERAEILRISVLGSGRKPEKIDYRKVAVETEGWVGSEIAALVPDAMFSAYESGGREITTEDLLAASRGMVPLSKTASIKLESLRDWAKGKAKLASTPPKESTAGGRGIEIDVDEEPALAPRRAGRDAS